MIQGIIIKGIGGFYYVKVDKEVYECRARGVFRDKKITPLVGDRVVIREKDVDKTGYIEDILERKNELLRPPVSNVDQCIIVASVKNPDLNLWLVDRFLILAKHQNLSVVICLNKVDLISNEEVIFVNNIYNKAGYKIINTSCVLNKGIEELRNVLHDNVTVFAGPSGVGKSSLLNKIQPNLKLNTGEISKKTKRGKHTTRHVELMELNFGGFVFDTPGFSSLDIDFIKKEKDLEMYFNEIYNASSFCKFNDCLHYKECDCEVKKLVQQGNISKERYDNYLNFLQEIKRTRRY